MVIIIPGSGPTDRNGDNPAGVAGAVYRQLAEQLTARGIATLRIDKRGMFGSRAAIANANAVTIADYAADAHAWAKAARAATGARCVWLLGHSEGGLVARCRVGRGRASVIADADFVMGEGADAARRVELLMSELSRTESR